MVELFAKFRTKIDFGLFKEEWVVPSAMYSGLASVNSIQLTLYSYNNAEYYAYIPILQSGKKYRIAYKIRGIGGSSPWVKVKCGTNAGTIRTTNGFYEDFIVANNANFGINWWGQTSVIIYDIEIEEVGYTRLDIFDTQITLNLGVQDIREINEKTSNYSNPFDLPGSQINNKFFKYVFDINNQNIFNINAKTSASISIDGIEYKVGYIKLENIVNRNNITQYKITFYGSSANLFADAKDKFLKDLDYSDINHTISSTALVNFWNSGEKVQYPYICYGDFPLRGVVGSALDKTYTNSWGTSVSGGKGLCVADYYPAIQCKYLIDKIFSTYGYTYLSDVFNSDWFSKTYLPFVNNEEILYQYYVVAKLSYDPLSISSFLCSNYSQGFGFVDQATGKYIENYNICAATDGIPSKINHGSITINPTKPIDEYLRCNNDNNYLINYTFGYNGGMGTNVVPYPQFINGAMPGCYVTKKSGMHRIKMRFSINNMVGSPQIKIYATRIPTTSIGAFGNSLNSGYPLTAFYQITGGETCELVQTISSLTGGYIEIEKDFYAEKDENIGFKFVLPAQYDYFDGSIDYIEFYEYGWGNGCAVDMKNAVPQDLKINDFLSSLFTMFNMYVEETENYKELNIQTYNDYFASGETKDFTYKLDRNSEQTIEFPSQYFSNNIILRYDEGDDTCNKRYSDQIDNKIIPFCYGGKKVSLDNEFAEENTEITINFAPTVLNSYWINCDTNPNQKKIVFSNISNHDYNDNGVDFKRQTKTSPRIIFCEKTDIFDNATNPIYFRFNATNYDYYMYGGHIRFPFDMTNTGTTLDLNFETALINEENVWALQFIGNPIGYVTGKNLYNNYWAKYITNFVNKDARILRANFRLNKSDVINLKMNDKIIIDNTKYIINKVNNLDVECKDLVEIELLKVNDLDITLTTGTTSTIFGGVVNPISASNFVLGGNNVISPSSSNSFVIGSNNIISKPNTAVIGSQNSATRYSSYIIGDGNNTQSERNMIFGNDNETSTGATKSVIIGTSNRQVEQNNIITLGGVTVEGNKISTESVNDGGEDTVAIDFTNQGTTDAGENKIYDPTYIDSNTVIDGGQD